MRKNYMLSTYKKSWTLDNAEEIFQEAKYTFFVPSKEQIANVKKGDIVKLIFKEKRYGAERMWVIVNGKKEFQNEEGEIEYKFSGTLNNQPFQLRTIRCDDKVIFKGCHIVSIYGVDSNRVHPDLEVLGDEIHIIEEKVWINKLLLNSIENQDDNENNDKGIEYIYREEPLSQEDSGWRFLTGDEDKEFLNDPNNFQFILFGRILNNDDSMLNLLTCEFGKHFKYNKEKNEWEELNDKKKFKTLKINNNNN